MSQITNQYSKFQKTETFSYLKSENQVSKLPICHGRGLYYSCILIVGQSLYMACRYSCCLGHQITNVSKLLDDSTLVLPNILITNQLPSFPYPKCKHIGRHKCPYMRVFKTNVQKTFLLVSKLSEKPFYDTGGVFTTTP